VDSIGGLDLCESRAWNWSPRPKKNGQLHHAEFSVAADFGRPVRINGEIRPGIKWEVVLQFVQPAEHALAKRPFPLPILPKRRNPRCGVGDLIFPKSFKPARRERGVP
jgi:hypothetical protein